ncbi:MAG: discoidin domain-containing protein [Phycisphaerae bacterium]|nr:discoidin domain-containing protein [Phycisphaerae bacterium]
MYRRMCLLTCLVLTCLMSSSVRAELIAYWPMDEGEGSTVSDAKGNWPGEITGDVTWVAGYQGSALEFPGGTNYVNCGNVQYGDTMSLSYWCFNPAKSFERPIGQHADNYSTEPGWAVYSRDENEGGVWFRVHGANTAWNGGDIIIADNVPKTEWYHLTFTFDGPSRELKGYLNGELKAEKICEDGRAVSPNANDLRMGHVGTGAPFTGMLDEVALFDHVLTEIEIQDIVTKGVTLGLAASLPEPKDGDSDVPRDVTMAWKPGVYAAAHDVYLGTVFDEVSDGTAGTRVSQGQSAAGFTPEQRLDFGQTYYWRVDEVNGTPDKTVFKGEVWSFQVEPYSVMIPVDVSKATASSSTGQNTPDMTVNGSGLEGSTHSEDSDTMWLSASGDLTPWLMVEFDQVQKLDHMLIWNSNSKSETFIGWGIKDVNIETSLDGVDWTSLAQSSQISKAPGASTYSDPQVIDLGLALAKYVRLNILSNWGGFLKQYGVSEVQFYGLPVYARSPVPASGSGDVLPDSVVSWRAGREAGQHTLYVSTDVNAVINGTAPSTLSSTHSLDLTSLDLQLDQTYYWRVDEVNEAEVPSVWAGPVWQLSTPSAWVVEDFEDYGNKSPNRPFQTWLDGIGYSADDFFPVAYGGNGTGAAIGHDIWSPGSSHFDGSIMETSDTIPGSRQSMPFYYSNTGSVASKTERTFAEPQDWTIGGAKTLSLAFKGRAGNTGTMFIMINNVKVTYDRDNGNLSRGSWQAWNIDLSTVNTTLSNITKLTLGVEGAGASGMILFDDIRLYPKAGEVFTPQDPDANGLVGAWLFDEGSGTVAADSSGNGRNGTMIDAAWDTGIQGQALSFNGTTAYVNIDGFKGINAIDGVQQPFTISNWIKTVSDGEMVTWGMQAAATRLSWRVEGGVLRTEHAAGNLRGNTPVNDDEWHHVALVVTEGASLRVPATQFYLDGLPDTTNSGSDTPYNLTPEYDVRIGMSGPLEDRFFTGLIDEVRLYDRALTGEELLWLAGWTGSIDKPF